MLASHSSQGSVGLREESGQLARITEHRGPLNTETPMWTEQTEHHGIARLGPADAVNWFNAIERSRRHLSRWEDWCDAIASVKQAYETLLRIQEWEIEGVFFPFCIVDLRNGQIVGGVSISNVQLDHRCANLGYWVDSQQQRQGLCTWAARAVASQAFRALQLTRLEVVVRTDNHASARVAHKLGAQHEGVARSRLFHQQRPYDAHVFSLLAGDTPLTT